MRVSPGLQAILAVLFCLSGAALAQQPGGAVDKAAQFEEDVARVERFLERRDFDRAGKALDDIFVEHADQDYVRVRSAELVELKRRSDFGIAVESPDPKGLVRGDLKSFSRTTGQLKIQYDLENRASLSSDKPEDDTDFITSNQLYIHKLSFGGPFNAEYKARGKQASLFLLQDQVNAIIVEAGMIEPRGEISSKNPIELVTAITIVRNDKRGEPKIKRERYRGRENELEIEFKVTSRYTDILVNRKKIDRIDTEDAFGRIALLSRDDMKFLEVSGKAEPAFLQDKIDAALGEQRKLFNKSWKASEVMPAWLFEKIQMKLVDGVAATKDQPGNVGKLNKTKALALEGAIETAHISEARDLRRDLEKAGLDELGKCWYDALTALEDGNMNLATSKLERLASEDARFLRGRALHMQLIYQLGDREGAGRAAKGLLEDFPNDAEAFEAATPILLLLGRAADGKVALDQAIARGLRSTELTRLNGMLVKALQGPSFPRRYEHKSKHYIVVSDIDSAVCRQAALALEQGYRSYEKALFPVEGENEPFEVFIFSGESGYADYSKGTLGSAMAGSAGLYSPLLKQLLIWNVPTRESMEETIRHEGFHQYLDRVLPNAPIWLNEGLAVYNETGKLEFGKWKTGEARGEYLRLFERIPLRPTEEFLKINIRQFQNPVNIHLNYGQAWLLVHYLQHSNDERKKLFDDLVNELRGGLSAVSVMEKVFEQVDLSKLHSDLDRHRKSITE